MADQPPANSTPGTDDFVKQLVPMILKSPIAIFCLCVTFLTGYGISFLLFDYRRNQTSHSNWIHLCLGGGYTALIFIVMNYRLVINTNDPVKLDDLIQRSPQTMLIGFAALFIVFCVITVIRETRRG